MNTRVTVNLSPAALAALTDMGQLTEETKTQVIGKALMTYAVIRKAQATGGGVAIQETSGGPFMRVTFS